MSGLPVDQQSANATGKQVPERVDTLWMIIYAPIVWAAHFALTYAGTAVYCARRLDAAADASDLVRVIGAFTGVALLIIIVLGWRNWRQWDYLDDSDYVHDQPSDEHRHEFLGHAAFLLAIVSFIGVCYTALPALYIQSCL